MMRGINVLQNEKAVYLNLHVQMRAHSAEWFGYVSAHSDFADVALPIAEGMKQMAQDHAVRAGKVQAAIENLTATVEAG